MASLEPAQRRGRSRVSRLFSRRRLTIVACLVVLAGIGLLLWARPGWSLEARLRAIDAAGWLCDQERQRSTIKRLTNVLTRARASRIIRELDLLELGRCRTSRILLALRRYRNEAGTWPGSLRQIESRVPPEVLIDPVSGKPFAYRLTDDGAFVYSVGLNCVDEDGIGGDDFFLWPN